MALRTCLLILIGLPINCAPPFLLSLASQDVSTNVEGMLLPQHHFTRSNHSVEGVEKASSCADNATVKMSRTHQLENEKEKEPQRRQKRWVHKSHKSYLVLNCQNSGEPRNWRGSAEAYGRGLICELLSLRCESNGKDSFHCAVLAVLRCWKR